MANEGPLEQMQDKPANDLRRPVGRRLFGFSGILITAITFTLVGILIASRMDFTGSSVASEPKTTVTPIVEYTGSYSSPFVAVIERVSDAVVSVSAKRNPHGESFGFFSKNKKRGTSSGTGFFFRADGYVLTNNHVVEDAESIEVLTASGFTYEARLVGLDPATDLAVLKVDTDDDITFITFGNSDSVRVGEWAIAIGNPFPQQGLFGSATVGIVSAKGRSSLHFGEGSPDYQDYIQVDAAINPGNSGGPLLNLKGEAFGINSAISSPTGASVGIGFAVPINIARAIIPDLIAYGEVRRGWLGIGMASVSPAAARRLKLDDVKGVVVEQVVPGSPADNAGLRVDDIIYEYSGHEVANPSQFSILVSTTKQGERTSMKVIRGLERLTLHAVIADKKSGDLAANEWFSGQGAIDTLTWMGMQLTTSTRNVAQRNGLDYTPGVLALGVRNRSQARSVGFAPGDVITEMSNQRISDLDDLRQVIDNLDPRAKTVSMIVVDRQGNTEYRTVRP